MQNANDKQVAGNHYKTGFQHWDMLVHPDIGMGAEYFIGQVTKYMSRWHKKNGLLDIRKAQHFAEKLLELVEGQPSLPLPRASYTDGEMEDLVRGVLHRTLDAYFTSNGITGPSSFIITAILFVRNADELRDIIHEIKNVALAEHGKLMAEPPVTAGYEFVGYNDDASMITWRSKTTGEERTLSVMAPPRDF